VWQVDLDLDGPQLRRAEALLTPDERARADRGTAQVRRHRVALRAALRTLLGHVLGCAAADVPLGTTGHGRPRLAVPTAGWDMNCTASDDLGLVAVARGVRVGIDVERVTRWTEATAEEGWLSAVEVSALRRLHPAEQAAAATRCWTQKEAVLKGLGTGLSLSPARIPTSPGSRSGRALGWDVTPVAVPPGFEASLATSSALCPPASTVVPRLLPDPAGSTGHPHDAARSL